MENMLPVFFYSTSGVLQVAIMTMIAAWVAMDAGRRGKSPALVFIAVMFFFPWGLISWLLFRPDPIDPPGGGFNLRDFRSQ
jgi:hypothetical protein